MLNILFLGDIVGQPGRDAVIGSLAKLKADNSIDFIIVNGENAANGRGITRKITIDLLRAGATVITTGDHIWDQRETQEFIETEPRLLRPLNYPPGAPGAGSVVLETPKGKVAVINICCRTFMGQNFDCPFRVIEDELNKIRQETSVIFVDVHGETTSEKIAMGRFLDGRVSAVIGTHTHVQTADDTVLPQGTAFLCDAGMCGARESILGRDIDPILQRFTTGMPARFTVAKGEVVLCGVVVSIDEQTGTASSIRRLQMPFRK
jgi:hypothetical protein